MYAIEKGIKIPPSKSPGRTSRYPWSELSIGDSFLVPKNGVAAEKLRIRLASIASYHQRKGKAVFTVRSLPNGVRVWRVR